MVPPEDKISRMIRHMSKLLLGRLLRVVWWGLEGWPGLAGESVHFYPALMTRRHWNPSSYLVSRSKGRRYWTLWSLLDLHVLEDIHDPVFVEIASRLSCIFTVFFNPFLKR